MHGLMSERTCPCYNAATTVLIMTQNRLIQHPLIQHTLVQHTSIMLATSSDTAADAKAGRHAMDSVPFDALRHTINIYYEPFLLNGQNCNIMNSKMSHGDKCTMTWL
jgi:hypothetical protein